MSVGHHAGHQCVGQNGNSLYVDSPHSLASFVVKLPKRRRAHPARSMNQNRRAGCREDSLQTGVSLNQRAQVDLMGTEPVLRLRARLPIESRHLPAVGKQTAYDRQANTR